MLERKRKSKHYDIVPGEEAEDVDGADLELGNVRSQEISAEIRGEEQSMAGAASINTPNVAQELDEWDEHAEDWDQQSVQGQKTSGVGAEAEGVNRND